MFRVTMTPEQKQAFKDMINTKKADGIEEMQFALTFSSSLDMKCAEDGDSKFSFTDKEVPMIVNLMELNATCHKELKIQESIYDTFVTAMSVH